MNIQLKDGHFLLNEKFNNINFSWSIPKTLNNRVWLFIKGIKNRGLEIAKQYGITKIKFNSQDIVVDCGANTSDLYIFFKYLNINIKYFAIEPGINEFNSICKNHSLNLDSKIDSKYFQIALLDINSEKDFYYAPDNADSSLIMPPNFEYKYTIKCKTLDTFIKENRLKDKRIKLLKLEAEGLEIEVLNGAIESLKNIEYIAADLGPERGLKQENTIVDSANLLYQYNFEMILFNTDRYTVLFRNKNY